MENIDLKGAYILLSVLLASSVVMAQVPDNLPYPNSALRIFNDFSQGLYNAIQTAENIISNDVLATENTITRLNAEVNIRGNIPALIAEVNQEKILFWQRTHYRISTAISMAYSKLQETVRTIQLQNPRTPYVERILNDVLRIGIAAVNRVKNIEAYMGSRLDNIFQAGANYVENLHEAALQNGPSDCGDVYEKRFEEVLPQIYPSVDRDIYGGLRRINGAVDQAVGEQRNDLSGL